jgi:hypothetical protein
LRVDKQYRWEGKTNMRDCSKQTINDLQRGVPVNLSVAERLTDVGVEFVEEVS